MMTRSPSCQFPARPARRRRPAAGLSARRWQRCIPSANRRHPPGRHSRSGRHRPGCTARARLRYRADHVALDVRLDACHQHRRDHRSGRHVIQRGLHLQVAGIARFRDSAFLERLLLVLAVLHGSRVGRLWRCQSRSSGLRDESKPARSVAGGARGGMSVQPLPIGAVPTMVNGRYELLRFLNSLSRAINASSMCGISVMASTDSP